MTKWLKRSLQLIAVITVFTTTTYAQRLLEQAQVDYPVSIDTKGQPTLGNPKAPIHIVVFEDLKCPNCARFNRQYFSRLKHRYIDTGEVKYTQITLAFINSSIPAGNAALCLYQQNKNLFFPFVEYVYQNQPAETTDWATIPKLTQFAKMSNSRSGLSRITTKNIHINYQNLNNCIFSGKYTDHLENNLKLASRVMNGRVVTPSIFVNGNPITTLTFKNLEKAINAARNNDKNG